MKSLILPFSKISNQDVKLAGGKGASLGEMTKAKLPVPRGFVILASTFDRFLEETDINIEIDTLIKKVRHNNVESVEKISAIIKDLIIDAQMPKDIAAEIVSQFKMLKVKWVAVRSSATAEDSKIASWAGELDTFLYINEKNLLDNVKKCWSSLFTPRAIFYRFEKRLHESKISVAVVVQAMVDSDVSGVAFSVHPVTKDKNQLIIEAGWGLGEAIVSGTITPDAYVINKKEGAILDINISSQFKQIILKPGGGSVIKPVPKPMQNKQKLSGKQIMELSKEIIKIEKHYKCPMDIEWAISKNKLYILQARPITTL